MNEHENEQLLLLSAQRAQFWDRYGHVPTSEELLWGVDETENADELDQEDRFGFYDFGFHDHTQFHDHKIVLQKNGVKQ